MQHRNATNDGKFRSPKGCRWTAHHVKMHRVNKDFRLAHLQQVWASLLYFFIVGKLLCNIYEPMTYIAMGRKWYCQWCMWGSIVSESMSFIAVKYKSIEFLYRTRDCSSFSTPIYNFLLSMWSLYNQRQWQSFGVWIFWSLGAFQYHNSNGYQALYSWTSARYFRNHVIAWLREAK